MSAMQHTEDLVSSPKRAPPPGAHAVDVHSALTWGTREAGGTPAGLPEVRFMAEPAERPRRQTKGPGISTWEAVSVRCASAPNRGLAVDRARTRLLGCSAAAALRRTGEPAVLTERGDRGAVRLCVVCAGAQ